ncbi:hypothetical protein DLM76_17245 [Leptospira yasudae]|uniref:hypothetical protein n=1 Tax=Leptospira yasudae TaxID=2202201 RepID=UPI000E59BC19|nr:hypothetical protein [Leptospira yasudae]RHX91473.1 hypothetical protein DLM76_17245 [Leptospira yasudae]
MADRYYIYYSSTGSGGTVAKPSGYSGFLHNPDAKRMSFLLPSDKSKAQEQIGKFIQDFQRLNTTKFKITNAVSQPVSQPKPPVVTGGNVTPGTGGMDPPKPPSPTTTTGTVTPEKKEDNTLLYVGIAIVAVIVIAKFGKKKRR